MNFVFEKTWNKRQCIFTQHKCSKLKGFFFRKSSKRLKRDQLCFQTPLEANRLPKKCWSNAQIRFQVGITYEVPDKRAHFQHEDALNVWSNHLRETAILIFQACFSVLLMGAMCFGAPSTDGGNEILSREKRTLGLVRLVWWLIYIYKFPCFLPFALIWPL